MHLGWHKVFLDLGICYNERNLLVKRNLFANNNKTLSILLGEKKIIRNIKISYNVVL